MLYTLSASKGRKVNDIIVRILSVVSKKHLRKCEEESSELSESSENNQQDYH